MGDCGRWVSGVGGRVSRGMSACLKANMVGSGVDYRQND